MHPRRSNKEHWVGASWLARQLGLGRKVVHYWAVKKKTRFFKMSGVRYIEKEDAKKLVKFLKINFPNRNLKDPFSSDN